MPHLDPMSLRRIANVGVHIDGPFERRGYELAQLLERSGWPAPIEYDGSPRVQWLTESITHTQADDAAVTRLICRLCDPLEYEDGLSSADAVRAEVNRILASERMVVSFAAGRPVLGNLADDGS